MLEPDQLAELTLSRLSAGSRARGSEGRRQCGPDPRAPRPGAIHQQSQFREDGLRRRPGGPRRRGDRRPGQRPGGHRPAGGSRIRGRGERRSRCTTPCTAPLPRRRHLHRRRGSRRLPGAGGRDAEDQEVGGQDAARARRGRRTSWHRSRRSTSGRPFVVGFAAETENVEENARAKLARKRVDMIAANRVGDGLAFDCDDNSLLVAVGRRPRGDRELRQARACSPAGGADCESPRLAAARRRRSQRSDG